MQQKGCELNEPLCFMSQASKWADVSDRGNLTVKDTC